ncbi:glycosyltransferase [Lysobacter niastensis]|uniref:Glycosyltransferase n=1 Tax=Lysobacter niastensis TaxID=380629 RepID=A0ABS0BCZ5_9GAMM|nr:glycosyltransferase [Lysobacter niastensis]MBF6025822.1 glycosyltransferase [Lysobacter niastensis]
MTVADRESLAGSSLFDERWYLEQYPEVAELQMSPLEHYLSIGADLGRDPGPGFSTNYYLSAYPDVAKDGVNPLLHYVKHGCHEGRSVQPRGAEAFARDVDIVVPVYNALDDLALCLDALVRHGDGYRTRVIVVNDGSGAETTKWLREFRDAHKDVIALVEHEVNRGYTRAVNTGLRHSDSAYVITLNSDTIVTPGWLAGLIRCARSSERIGIVGALSNAATWQSVPELFDYTGAFAINELIDGVTPDGMARIVAEVADRNYPRVNFINGFCFLIKREVVEAIGVMDEQAFPEGYGEENDYCIRAADAGYELAIAVDSYVYHAKSKSFGHERRRALSKRGAEALARKHTAQRVAALVADTRCKVPLERIRQRIRHRLARHEVAPVDPLSLRIVFLLPVKGGSGGAHSVVQEVAGLRRLGVNAKVAVRATLVGSFLAQYAELEDAEQCFVGFDEASLPALADDADILVATIFTSVTKVRDLCSTRPWVLPAYYVQDYEPLFFEPATDHWHAARASYTALPSGLLFAKTHWICEQVENHHGVKVNKVLPSIDHAVYKPVPRGVSGRSSVRVSAMIRPQTPRRGAARTMRVLKRLVAQFGHGVSVNVFGCESDSSHWGGLEADFAFTNHGTLKREEVASVLSASDVFIDLSDYQAFGRTALEAMACGAVSVVPCHGGADEYAVDGVNAIVVDPFDENECAKQIEAVVGNPPRLASLKVAAMAKASEYSIHRAAMSELAVFASAVAEHRMRNKVKPRRTVHVLPAINPDGSISVRSEATTLLPLMSPEVMRRWRVNVVRDALPEAQPGEAVVLSWPRHDMGPELEGWVQRTAQAGASVVLDVTTSLTGAGSCIDVAVPPANAHVPERVRRHVTCVVIGDGTDETLFAWCDQVKRRPCGLAPQLWFPSKQPKKVSDKTGNGRLKIGFLGTLGTQSMQLLKAALQVIEREHGAKVQVEVIGAFQSGPVEFGARVGLPRRRDYLGFVDWLHRRVDWDICLLPCGDDPVARTAFLEVAALGSAIVCSRSAALEGLARDGKNCLMAGDQPLEWASAIGRLIDESKLRSNLANAALLDSKRECVDGAPAGEFVNFFEGL